MTQPPQQSCVPLGLGKGDAELQGPGLLLGLGLTRGETQGPGSFCCPHPSAHPRADLLECGCPLSPGPCCREPRSRDGQVGGVGAGTVAWLGLSSPVALFYCFCFDISVAGFNMYFWSEKIY